MKVVIDITEDTLHRIKEVNHDSSLAGFICVAIENQLSLEKDQHLHTRRSGRKIRHTGDRPLPSPETIAIVKNPLHYELLKGIPSHIPLQNYYLWGQYNKFFPVKFAVRYLAYMQIENNADPVPLPEFQIRCSRSASGMKRILKESDTKAGRIWGEGFAVGLPDNQDKSWTRFINHFIGYTDSWDKPVGALPDLGFIVIEKESVALSPHGLVFARISNPVLDTDVLSSHLFSQEEKDFLILYLKRKHSVEWDGYQKVMRWIGMGFDTPAALNEHFSTLDRKWTKKMANTYRTGMIGRMVDLGLIARTKTGVRVKYIVTDFGIKMEEPLMEDTYNNKFVIPRG